jgi:hypothetical protein
VGITSLSQANAEAATGLVLVATSSFSAASSVSVNECFTSSYTNYRILLYGTSTIVDAINLRMRLAGTDDTSANYASQYLDANSTSLVGARAAGATSASIGVGETAGFWCSIDIYQPALAVATYFTSAATRSVTTPIIRDHAGGHNVATAYDGFTIYPTSGTITGVLAIYGYRKAL